MSHSANPLLRHNQVDSACFNMKYNEERNERRNPSQPKETEMTYDSVEESLRDALRHGVKNGAKPREEPQPLQENTFTKRHNYITVYEHDQQRSKHRNIPNAPEDYRTHPNQAHSAHVPNVNPPMHTAVVQNGNGSLGVEEFRKYCVFLTERMQKMEEQNDQLARLAEQQKHEYSKVASQIAQSEMIQRKLQDECVNLRRQVQHLTSYNNKLKESVPLHGNNLLIQGESPPRKHVGEYGMPARETVSLSSMQNLHSGANQNMGEPQMPQFGGSMDNVSQRDLSQIKREDMSSIIELYNALQRHTNTPPRSQPSPPEISGEPHEGAPVPPQSHPLGVIHEQPVASRSDYATPSSVCATRSCTCCNSRTASASSKLSGGSSPARDTNPKPSNLRVAKLNKAARGGDRSQSFDNNAYIEVELKHYEHPDEEADPLEVENVTKVNFRRDNRLRRSHNHYMNVTPKRSEPQRPSSLVLDLDTVQAAMDGQIPPHPGVVTLSPVSPYENHVIPVQSKRNDNNGSLNKKMGPKEHRHMTKKPPMSPISPTSPREKPLGRSASTDGKIWYPRSSSASSTHSAEQRLTSADSGHVTSPGSPLSTSGGRKSFSKLESVSDLPPPPPPPPQADEDCRDVEEEQHNVQEKVQHTNTRTSAEQRNERSPDDVKKHNKSAFSQIRPRKLSVWKQSGHGDGASGSAAQNSSGWRRKSYAAACRKSQSLDHLYEHILMENNSEKKDGEDVKAENGSTTFSTLQLNRTKPLTSPVRKLPETLPGTRHAQVRTGEEIPASEEQEEDVFMDDLPPPPPPQFLQEVMSQDGQSTGYAVMAPVDYDRVTKDKQEKDVSHHPPLVRKSSSKSSLQKRISVDRDPHSKSTKNYSPGGEKTKLEASGNFTAFDSRLPKSRDAMDDDYDEIIDDGLRRRRMSEGSAGRRKKEIQESSTDDGKSQLRRRRSISSDFAVSKRRETAIARHGGEALAQSISSKDRAQSVDQVTSARSDINQRKFPSTNPNLRLGSGTSAASSGVSVTKSPQRSPEIARSIRTESLESGSSLSQCSQSTERRSLLSLNSSKGKGTSAQKPNQVKKIENSKLQQRGRSTSKTEISSKKNKDPAASSKKRTSSGGGSQSRSLVDIMKSKFGRSVSGSRSTSAGKKSEATNATKNPDLQLPEPQLKPASSFIDPRTLSLEPNSYLPPGKDGFSTGSKQRLALGGGSDAAVGKKLSQPYPNGSSASAQPLTKLVEEVVSDEGFAEGSTIERPDKDQIPEPDAAIESRRFEETSFPDVGGARKSERRAKKDNTDWYESVVTVQSGEDAAAKRFHIVSTEDLSENTPENRFIRRGSTRQQQHTRPKPVEEPPYENLPIDRRHIMPHQINTFDSELNNNNEKRLSVISKTGAEVFAAGVTIVRTPPTQQSPLAPSSSPPTRPKPTRQLQKSQRSPGSAIGRIMKTASRLSGSKEDISHKSDSSGGSTPKSRKPDKDPSGKKINYSAHQKVFEKAFISSVVEAELTQRTSGRNSPQGSITHEKSNCDSTGRNPISLASSGADSVINGSVGTGSSFGSLPSDGLVDVTEFHGTTSSSTSDHVTSKPNQQRLSKSKRNSNSGFGFSGRVGNTGTNESSSSSSSTEITYRGRSKTTSSSSPGIRSPVVSSPPGGSIEATRGQARSSSCASSRSRATSEDVAKPPEYHNSISKPPAYSEPPPPPPPTNKTTSSIKSIQSRRSQSGSRISRLSTPATKLQSTPGKSSSRSHSTSSQDGSPSSAASKPQSPKLKLAPLNYGITPNRSRASGQGPPTCRDQQEPIYENSIIAHQNHQSKLVTPPPNSNIPSFSSSIRPPTATLSSSVPSSRPPSGCASSQLEARRTKRNIPSGLHRPRPVNLGVGAS